MFSTLIINFLLGFLISLFIIESVVFIFGLFKEEEKPKPKTHLNLEKIIERNVKKVIDQIEKENTKEEENTEEENTEEENTEEENTEEENTENNHASLEELLKHHNLEIIKPVLDDLGVISSNDLKLLTLPDIQEIINKKEDIKLKLVEIKKLELLMKK